MTSGARKAWFGFGSFTKYKKKFHDGLSTCLSRRSVRIMFRRANRFLIVRDWNRAGNCALSFSVEQAKREYKP